MGPESTARAAPQQDKQTLIVTSVSQLARMHLSESHLSSVQRKVFDDLLASFGNLDTIAGTGTQKDTNGWLPAFEGAPPTSVELSNPHMCMADAFGRIYIAD